MPLEYKVFHAVGVVVAEVKSSSLLSILKVPDDGSVDFSVRNPRLDVDLTHTPDRALIWSDVEFDDCHPRLTTIGSGTLNNQTQGGFVGALYIEQKLYQSIYGVHVGTPGQLQDWPPLNTYDLAELTSIAYSPSIDNNGDLAKRRFRGYMATIIELLPNGGLRVSFKLTPSPLVDLNPGDFHGDPPPEAFCGKATSLAKNQSVQQTGVLFIDLERLKPTPNAVLQLDDPKIPIGLDGGSSYTGEPPRVPDFPVPPVGRGGYAGSRINLSVRNTDGTLQTVLARINGEALVPGVFTSASGLSQVADVIRAMALPRRPVALDLIAHAKKGILQFGQWSIDEVEDVSTQLLKLLHQDPKPCVLGEVRLLGCCTAGTKAGQAAMRHLKKVLHVPIYGATKPLYVCDFGPQGFIADQLLAECNDHDLPEPFELPVSDAVVDSWFGRFEPIPSLSVTDLVNSLASESAPPMSTAPPPFDAVSSSFRGQIATAPGLLEVPDFEQLYQRRTAKGNTVFHRVTSFFGGKFVRVYPQDRPDGVLVRSHLVASSAS